MKLLTFITIVLIFISGCSTKQININKKPTKGSQIVFKTKKTRFSGTGFYKDTPEYVQLQIYSTGVALANLKFYKNKDLICEGYKCNNRRWFTDNFLSKEYPDDLIIKIMTKQPLGYKSESIKYKTDDGIYFKDTKNRILIKIKELK